jgi:hypothetical protein
MLYCPKCQDTYPDGTQRFCTNEGARLLPFPAAGSSDSSADTGVFTSILNKKVSKKTESVSEETGVLQKDYLDVFEPPVKSKFFKSEGDADEIREISKEPEIPEEILEITPDETFESLPIARIIDPSSIPEINPAARTANSRAGQKATSPGLVAKNKFDSEIDDVLDFGDAPDTVMPTENFEFESDDLLDTGELFEPVGSSQFAESKTSDVLALPEIELDLDEITAEKYETEPASEMELELEDRNEMAQTVSTSAIELEIDELADERMPSSDSEPDFSDDDYEYSAPIVFARDETLQGTPEVAFEDTFEGVSEFAGENVPVSEGFEGEPKPSTTVVIPPMDVSAGQVKASDDGTWEKRSSEMSDTEESRWFLYPLLGLVVLGLGLIGYFYLTSNNNLNNDNSENIDAQAVGQSNLNLNTSTNENANLTSNTEEELIPPAGNPDQFRTEPRSALLDIAPPPRNIKQPPNTKIFRNERKDHKGVLAEKFLGFSIYYPKDWKQTKADNKFLDIAKKAPDGLPIKQLLITRYDSMGTFEADRGLFDELVKTSNSDLRNILANYQVISEGESTFQDGRWRTYEVKFQGIGSDKKLIIWGRRLWIPVQRPGMTSGFIITMIGTSLSKDIKSVEDLGVNDDLAEILETFEPEIK